MFAIIGGDWRNFKPLFEYYKQAYLDNGHDPEKFQVGVHMHSFFGENAEEVANSYYPVYSAKWTASEEVEIGLRINDQISSTDVQKTAIYLLEQQKNPLKK